MDSDIDNLQTGLNKSGESVAENDKQVNPGKSKTLSFINDGVKARIWYYFGDQLIPDGK
jgi:hypothetical protein